MRKKLSLLALLILVFVGFTAGEIFYSIDADQDDIKMNSTVKMECEKVDSNCPVNVWTLTLNKPENSTVLNVESSLGDVEQYDVRGDRITVETRSDEPRESVSIRVNYKINKKAENVGDGLYYHQIGLPGFQGERNYGKVETEDMIYADVSHGFKSSLQDDVFQFSGQGPANADLNFGDGYKTDYFEFFGGEPERTEKAYEISAGIVGFHQRFDRLPTVILDNKKYNETVNRWSRGQYKRGRLILREDLGEEFLPILAHETVHGLNDEFFEWDQTDSSYFDEGVSKYIESLVRKTEVDHPTRELFGDEVSYVEEEDGKRYRYTLPSKGDKEQLWDYYQSGSDAMKAWNAESQNRAFGYAYSELVIRNYVANEEGSVRELYSKLNRQEKIERPQQKWDYFSNYLDMTPCKYSSREKFEECLEGVNEFDYTVFKAEPRTRESESLEIGEINLSEPKKGAEKVENRVNRTIEDEVEEEYNQSPNPKDGDGTGKSGDKTGSLVDRISRSIERWLSHFLHI